jgi:hypothetical protein
VIVRGSIRELYLVCIEAARKYAPPPRQTGYVATALNSREPSAAQSTRAFGP